LVDSDPLTARLEEFRQTHAVFRKGGLSVVLFLTRKAQTEGLRISLESLRTERQGQVAGLGRSAIKRILADYGIQKPLASEAGRTSRGSLGLAEEYTRFLNDLFASGRLGRNDADINEALKRAEAWWIDRVNDYFNTRRFELEVRPELSVAQIISNLLADAKGRQRALPGSTIEGAVLHHLIGTKLALKYGDDRVPPRSYSTADAPTQTAADYVVGSISFHVTTSPSEGLMEKCRANIGSRLRPVVIVPSARLPAAQQIAEMAGILERVEIYGAEQFLSANIYEKAGLGETDPGEELETLKDKYNERVALVETDLSLQIE
jgi:hypothetical protein